MLRLGNRETKTVTVTQNLMLELKYDTVTIKKTLKKLITTFRSGRPLRSSPARLSKLPAPGSRAVLMVIPCYYYFVLYLFGLEGR